eukprot:Rhum_TRINITY_DN14473_c9_g1::Rhum_TRINITY_DN14473_c9_g1_i1::g.93379::m.93379
MMRLPLLAVFALAATAAPTTEEPVCSDTKPCPQTGDPKADTHFCRPAVAASGAACEAEKVTCAKLSVRGESCGGTGLECFRNKCAGALVCRKNPVTLPGDNPPELPGTCAKQCDLGGDKKVFEGWTGPVDATPANWCKTRYCDGSGATDAGELKDTTGNPDTCPTDVASGLKCCPEADKAKKAKDTDPEPVQVCCGATGKWIVLTEADGSDKKEKQYCAHVLAAKDSTAAPFSESCKDQCSVADPAMKFDDGWKGPDVREGKWCNTCVCTRTQMQCTDRPCPKLQCCAEGDKTAPDADEVCCGVTGKWVAKDAADMVTCHGVTRAFDAEVAAPFHAKCDALRDCKFTSNVEVTVKNGESAADPRPGQGCNLCACADGKLTCATEVCEAPKCCAAGDKTMGTAEVCCGLTGAWVAVETEGAKCGSHAAKVNGAAATGYPFFKECDPQCAANTAAGGPDKMVPLGWTAPSAHADAKWCDLCKCAVAAGAPAGTAPVVTCTTLAGCPETKCCRSDNNKVPEGFACCGATRKWVKVDEKTKKVMCAGVTLDDPGMNTPKAPLATVCDAPVECTLPGGKKLGDGLTGRAAGDEWCNLCRCDAGAHECTKHTCTKKCCDKATRPSDAYRCCGADGLWVAKRADDTFMCGGVLVAADAAHVYPATGTEAEQGICEVATATMCKLRDAAETEVALGWSGSGRGDKWCHTCKCRAADLGKPVWCPATPATCPEQAALRCCEAEITAGNVCCGLTGEVVPEAGMCGSVNLKDAGFAADKAPLGAACPKCTVDGHAEPQAAGWKGYVLGDNWCKQCQCIAGGHTRCFAEGSGCPELKCCRPNTKPAGVDSLCCGATGEWVEGDVMGVAECAGHKTAANEAAPKKPFHTGTCDDPAGGCTIPNVDKPVPVGWVGKVNCNYCACLAMDVHRCTTRTCL